MARRTLLKPNDRTQLFGIPSYEESLIRHYTLSAADLTEVEGRRRAHNKIGFAIQLCLMRYPGRVLQVDEIPPKAMLDYVAQQIGINSIVFQIYAEREETRREHANYLSHYVSKRPATAEDRRAALTAALHAASEIDSGFEIASAIVTALREQEVLLPALETLERIGLAARSLARRQAEERLVSEVSLDTRAKLEGLLKTDPALGQTPLYWLRSASEAPGAYNLLGLLERLEFLRALHIDPDLQTTLTRGRWDQMVRESDVTPAWLAGDFKANRRLAMFIVQVLKLMGRLFSQANNKKKQQQINAQKETSKALRLFLKTISTLQSARESGEDALAALDRQVGWFRSYPSCCSLWNITQIRRFFPQDF